MKQICLVFPPLSKGGDGYYFRVRQEIAALEVDYKVKIIRTVGNQNFKALRYFLDIPRSVSALISSQILVLYPSYLSLIILLIGKILNKKVVMDHFTTWMFDFEFTKSPIRFLFKIADQIFYKSFDLVITHSESMGELLTKNYDLSSDKVYVFYSSVDVKYIKQTVSETDHKKLRKELGIERFKNIVIYTGLFHKFHGTKILIQSIRKSSYKNTIFILVGRKLPRLANTISLDPVPYERLVQILSLGDLWVGALTNDAQGNRAMSSNLVLALSVGLPVIVGASAENKKFITHENGVLLQNANWQSLNFAIRSTLANKDLKEMGHSSHRVAHQYFSLRYNLRGLSRKFASL